MGSYTNLVRGIVKKNPQLKLKLKKANEKKTEFQYVNQSITMTGISLGFLLVLIFMIFKNNLPLMLIIIIILFFISPLIYSFWFGYVDVQIRKYGRELESDLLFVSEYFLVSLSSGLPLGNAIERFSRLKRPGAEFFKRIYIEFQTGKDLETSLRDASTYSPSETLRVLLKRLEDSLVIGVDLKTVLENYIKESSEKKIIAIKGFSKKLNPIIMIYLLMGIVLPSLGITFFILAAAMLDMTPELLKVILFIVFMVMFLFQYLAYSMFKFTKTTI